MKEENKKIKKKPEYRKKGKETEKEGGETRYKRTKRKPKTDINVNDNVNRMFLLN